MKTLLMTFMLGMLAMSTSYAASENMVSTDGADCGDRVAKIVDADDVAESTQDDSVIRD